MPESVALDLIHGFTQDRSVWQGVASRLPATWKTAAEDLPGHGCRSDERPRTAAAFLEAVRSSIPDLAQSEIRILCGYSMGARIAMQLGASEPGRWTHVVAISSGPGIASPQTRAERRAADEEIARRLESDGIDAFSAFWNELPIWTGDPASVAAGRRAMISGQDASGLAAALRASGQGTLPPFTGWNNSEPPHLLVIRGSRDSGYAEPSAELARRGSGSVAVVEGGHSLPLESPAAIAAALIRFAG